MEAVFVVLDSLIMFGVVSVMISVVIVAIWSESSCLQQSISFKLKVVNILKLSK